MEEEHLERRTHPGLDALRPAAGGAWLALGVRPAGAAPDDGASVEAAPARAFL